MTVPTVTAWADLGSPRTLYAIRALADLAIAAPRNVRGTDLAYRYHVPPDYLYEILAALRRARLITSHRGRGGGFGLARPAATITLADATKALGVPMTGSTMSKVNRALFNDGLARRLQQLWTAADAATLRVLTDVSLADLVDDDLGDERHPASGG